jgi:hypothetical protein
MHGRDKKCIQNFGWKTEGKRPLRRPNCRWEDIRMDLNETEWEGVDWMHLAQDRDQVGLFVNTIINLRDL